MTPGPTQRAVRARVAPGTALETPSQAAPFTVATIDVDGVVLLLGEQEAYTRITWEALEGILDLLHGSAWVRIGGSYTTDRVEGTLDGYLKGHIKRATAGWVASLLEAAGVVEIDRRRPARVRLAPQFERGLS